MKNLMLSAKFTILSSIVVAIIAIAAVESYVALGQISKKAEQAATANLLLSNHMDSDMMHDAMRGDVMKSMLGLAQGDTGMINEAKSEAEEHGQRFAENFAASTKLENVPPEIRAALEEAAPALKDYKEKALKVIDAASNDAKSGSANAKVLMPQFSESFSRLEEVMESITNKIDAAATKIKTEQVETASRSNALAIIMAIITIIASVSVPVFAKRSLFAPQAKLMQAMESLAGGNIDIDVPFINRHDEIGAMARTLQVFKRGLEERKRLTEESDRQKKMTEAERRKAMTGMADNFEKMAGAVVAAIGKSAVELQKTARVMQQSAQETSAQSNTVAAASEQATSNVQTVASATEELSASVREIQARMESSGQMVAEAASQASATNGKVRDLTAAAEKIGAIVNLINDIAAQTNLLALNATIEAARAGDAGKGFAVVASEVKNLAGQTAKATDEIAAQVKSIQEATGASAAAIEGITQMIYSVRQESSDVSAAIGQQGAATQEIARNVAEAAAGTREVSGSIISVSEAAQRTGSAAAQVLSAAEELAKNGQTLENQVAAFLREVRAG